MKALTSHAAHHQFLRYFFVGGSAGVVDLCIFTIFHKYIGLNYFLAATIGYMFGLAWNHLLSVLWVFKDSKHNRLKEILIVIGIAIGGLLWTWIILYILVDLFSVDAVIAKAASQFIVLGWNFGMRKLVVFH